MKLGAPYKVPYQLTQGFSQNHNTYYAEDKLLGHTGQDYFAGYGSEIVAVADSYCYSYINKDNRDLMRFRAVYTLWEDAGVWYEIVYGHLINIFAKPKTFLKKGQVIGTEGNTGDVASGGKKITLKEKMGGSHAGSHLHFQMRLVKPVTVKEKGKKYLQDMNGILTYQNKMWEVINPKNGFAGCIDPAPFFSYKDVYPVLKYGIKGEAVKALQKLLKIPMDGIFGLGTEKVVKTFQKKEGLVSDGVVGQKTWAKLLGN